MSLDTIEGMVEDLAGNRQPFVINLELRAPDSQRLEGSGLVGGSLVFASSEEYVFVGPLVAVSRDLERWQYSIEAAIRRGLNY